MIIPHRPHQGYRIRKVAHRLEVLASAAVIFCSSGSVSAGPRIELADSVRNGDRVCDACVSNLHHIFDAAKAYERAKGELPSRLSDLAGQWIDPEALICPVSRAARTAAAQESGLISWLHDDPLTTYEWEYHRSESSNLANGRLVRSAARQSPVGESAALVRCDHHRRNARETRLNLGFNGIIYWSGLYWEEVFVDTIPMPYLNPYLLAKRPMHDRIRPRDRSQTRAQIDLTSHWNALLADPWFDGSGSDTLSGIEEMGADDLARIAGRHFDIRGIVQLDGWVDQAESVAGIKPIPPAMQGEAILALPYAAYPRQSLGMPVKQLAPKLAFLIGGIYPSPVGTAVARFLVHYSDNGTVSVPVVYGVDLVDGWYDKSAPERQKTCQTKCVYTGPPGTKRYKDFSGKYVNRTDGRILVFLKTWTNPFPSVLIDHIDFLSSALGNSPAPTCPFLLGITVGPNEK